jgi:hypothetical protein
MVEEDGKVKVGTSASAPPLINCWSGPRSMSTTLTYSFLNRGGAYTRSLLSSTTALFVG